MRGMEKREWAEAVMFIDEIAAPLDRVRDGLDGAASLLIGYEAG